MKISQLNKKVLLTISVISVIINIIIILPYVKPCFIKIRDRYFPLEDSTNVPDSIMLNTVLSATLTNKGVRMSMNESKGLFYDLKSYFLPKRGSLYKNNFYTSYALVGASYYAMYTNDTTSMNIIKKIADESINTVSRKLNYELIVIDQAPIGILFLNLYKHYEDDLYLNVAKNIFHDILNKQKTSIIKYRVDSDCQYVDVLGMYVPFFMEYFYVTKDSLAYSVVDYNMKEYYKYGVNKETGIPSHGYNLINKVQVGSSNWGRGIGWYLLAAAYCPQINDSKLDSTLLQLDYTQFPGWGGQFDSSTALMFEIYKQSKDDDRQLDLSFIKQYVTKDGFVRQCSGDTYGLNDYSHTFSESELCNGFLLMLSSKFRN